MWPLFWLATTRLEGLRWGNIDLSMSSFMGSFNPFKPIESASENLLSLNVALLVAIAFLKSVGFFQALSVTSYLDFAPGVVKVILPSRPDCVPKGAFITV